MPPRSAKKVVAKKGTPKPKQEPVTPSVETKVSPSNSTEAKKVTEAVIPSKEKTPETVVSPKESAVVKMEVTRTVVEETKVVEETVEEKQEIDVEMTGTVSDDEEPGETEDAEPEEIEDAGSDEEQDVAQDDEAANGEGNGHVGEGDALEGEVANSSGSDDEEDEDPSAYIQLALSDRKKPKDLEIFVGGLDRKAVEEDLTKVFGEFGEIQELRIVKHPVTQKSKGFAFLRYANIEQTKKVLTELKDGIEVNGKRVGISASQDSDTLYVGNICKTWTKEQLLEALKNLGIEKTEETYLPEDPSAEGKIRGFALLEFSTHADAMAAFQRLRKPDAVLGRDRSAKVAFAQSMHPSEEALLQVKTVYLQGLTDTWDEEKLKATCTKYGEIVRISLSRNLRAKKKDFGFVEFTSRDSALACIEEINNAQIGEGDTKVKAELAKPEYKGRLGKNARGGYKVSKDGETTQEPGSSKKKGNTKSKGAEVKEKSTPKPKGAKGKSKPKSKGEARSTSAPFKSNKNPQRNEGPSKGKKRDGRSLDAGSSGRPSKKSRGNTRGGPSGGSGNRTRNAHPGHSRQSYAMAPRYADPYRQGYASGPVYPAYGAAPGSSRSYSDMEPHAGYLRSSSRKQDRETYAYGPRSGYGAQGSSGAAYGPGAPPPPPAYAPGYSSYPGYSGGGYVYPSSGAYPPRQGYHY